MTIREKRCETCRWWDAHSTDLKKGDCRAPAIGGVQHRFSRALMPPCKDGQRRYAYLDAFGPEEAGPHFVCGRWEQGHFEALSPDRPREE